MINNLEEYISKVNEINKKWNVCNKTTHSWYRGQGDAAWDLQPGIYRRKGTSVYERELIRDFKLNASRFVHHIPESDFGWLYLMQHYGMPTRLIDWTESYLVALYFAVINYSNTCDGVVWLLEPWALNKKYLNQKTVPEDSHPELKKYLLDNKNGKVDRYVIGEDPVALRPNRVSPRIIAQKGVFTIHGKNKTPLNHLNGFVAALETIKVCGKSKLNLLKELNMAGISHSVLFPEMDGLAKEISFRYSLEYLGPTNGGHHHHGF